MSRLTTIEISNEYLKFSAAHFTIFSATDRERLHGHNFAVRASFISQVGDDGLGVNYSWLKQKVALLCELLDEYTHIPVNSPYLEVTEEGDLVLVTFNQRTLTFPQEDVLLLPLRNTTVEEYSWYLLEQLVSDQELLESYPLQEITLTVSSGPGQSGSTTWQR